MRVGVMKVVVVAMFMVAAFLGQQALTSARTGDGCTWSPGEDEPHLCVTTSCCVVPGTCENHCDTETCECVPNI
jgi:hypothetical protein